MATSRAFLQQHKEDWVEKTWKAARHSVPRAGQACRWLYRQYAPFLSTLTHLNGQNGGPGVFLQLDLGFLRCLFGGD